MAEPSVPLIRTLPEYYAWREEQAWWQEGEQYRREFERRITPVLADLPRAAGHFVYRLWDAANRCIYVGMVGTRGPRLLHLRMAEHRRIKDWWPEVARIDAITCDEDSVREEEAIQIRALRPVRNMRNEARLLPKWMRRG